MTLDRASVLRHHHHQRSPGRELLDFIATTGWHYVCPSFASGEASGPNPTSGGVS